LSIIDKLLARGKTSYQLSVISDQSTADGVAWFSELTEAVRLAATAINKTVFAPFFVISVLSVVNDSALRFV